MAKEEKTDSTPTDPPAPAGNTGDNAGGADPRPSGTADGGGAFPPELLVKRYVGAARPLERDIGAYTSHET